MEEEEVSPRFPWHIPKKLEPDARPIAEEIIRRGSWDETLGKRYQSHARIWTSLSYVMGASAATLAAIAGFLAANNSAHNTLVGALALASAAIGVVLTFLNPASRASDANARAQMHFRTSSWARYIITTELPAADFEAARKLLRELQSKQDGASVAST
jgi:hypothetical protein